MSDKIPDQTVTTDTKNEINGNKRAGEVLNNYKQKLQKGEDKIKLNELYLKDTFVKDFRKQWDQKIEIQDENLRTIHNPFHIGVLQNFLNDESIKHLVKEFNDVEWHRKQMDLYEFHQTLDLCNFNNVYLKIYYNYLKTVIMPWMSELTGLTLTHVSSSCSMYNAGDHLLVHDDLLSDRKIAYILYLSPWENHQKWDEKTGGALEILRADENNLPIFPVVEKIYPTNNQLLFFKVSESSFHQVDEVTTLEYPRLSINGWFHGPVDDDRNTDLPSICEEINFKEPHNDILILSEWMNNIYLIDEIKENLQKAIEVNSEACLEEFLMPEMFDVMLEDFKTNTELEWSIKGPAHLRKYDILNVEKTRAGPVHDLYKLFTSREMFKLFYDYTELDLFGKNAKSPSCSIELQRWTKGCYTVLGDPSTYADSTLDVFLFFNAIENVGVVTYLLPEEDQHLAQYKNAADENDEDDPVLLTIYPKNNALNVVFRSEGTTKFMKYVSKNTVVNEQHGYSYILVCSYRE